MKTFNLSIGKVYKLQSNYRGKTLNKVGTYTHESDRFYFFDNYESDGFIQINKNDLKQATKFI